jgi:hypothetical protein
VRGAAEGTAAVARGAARGTAGVARGAAEGTAAVTRGAARGTAGVARGTANVVRGTGQAVGNAVTGNALNNDRNAPWRFTRHNGEWWYYTPQNQWMYHRNGQWNAYSANNFQRLNATAGNTQIAQGGPAMQQGAQRFSYAPGQQAQQVQQNYAPAAGAAGGAVYQGGFGPEQPVPAAAPASLNTNHETFGDVTRPRR